MPVVVVVCLLGIINTVNAQGVTSDWLALYDTVVHSSSVLSSYEIRNKKGWKLITDESEAQGDLCIETIGMDVMLRQGAPGIELYYKLGKYNIHAATLYPSVGEKAGPVRVSSFTFHRRPPNIVGFSVGFVTGKAQEAKLNCVIKGGQAVIEVRPGRTNRSLVLDDQSQFIVMPDLFADDLVWDTAAIIAEKTLFLPQDNYLMLHMLPRQEAMLVANWLGSRGDITVHCRRDKQKQAWTSSSIPCAENRIIWISFMARRDIWHAEPLDNYRIDEHLPLNWKVPFSADWRVDFRRSDRIARGLTDSFWNAELNSDGTFKPVANLLDMKIIAGQYLIGGDQEKKRLVNRHVLNPYTGTGRWSWRGWFIQPFYFNRAGQAYLQIPVFDQARHIRYDQGVLIYPLLSDESLQNNPVTVETILRQTLGDDYLQLLDWEALNKRHPHDYYPPTCTTTRYCEEMFPPELRRFNREYFVKILGQMQLFIKYMNQRLREYVAWEKDLARYLALQDKGNIRLRKYIHLLQALALAIPRKMVPDRDNLTIVQYADRLVEQAVNTISSSNPRRFDICKKIFSNIRKIGGSQDELLGEYRERVRLIRQHASLLLAGEPDPQIRAVLHEVRRRTQQILRIRYDMEGK